MSEQILVILKRKLKDLAPHGALDAETSRNTLKEELQFFVLNFVCHHPEYNKWIMYGGSALRIIHGLDRMSVDLDFEVSYAITGKLLGELKREIEKHFSSVYGVEPAFLTIKIVAGRGLLLKFNVGEELSFNHPSKQVHIKLDLNHFVAPKAVTERRPVNRDHLSFVVLTYNMSALMASKIAAIFLRGTRGVGTAVYGEKGRDIYDLLWYMNKKVIPDLDYLTEKGIDVKDPRALFDKLTIQMNKVNDANLKQDLLPLFTNRTYIENWRVNWRASYLRLLDEYKIRTVTKLKNIQVHQELLSDIFYFIYSYETEEGSSARIIYALSEYWISFREGDLAIEENNELSGMIEFASSVSTSHPPSQEKIKRYAALFYLKTETYFKKTSRVMLGEIIRTKLIRMTADKLNPKEQIVLNKSALLSCELDDLLM